MTKRYFNKDDVAALVERAKLKAKVDKLDRQLKPKIKAACDALGDGATIMAGGKVITLQQIKAQIVEWRSVAHAVADEETVNQMSALPIYSKTRTTNKAKVGDR